jgi:hypothetical protein
MLEHANGSGPHPASLWRGVPSPLYRDVTQEHGLFVSPKFRPKFMGFKTRLTGVKGRSALGLPADESPAIAL